MFIKTSLKSCFSENNRNRLYTISSLRNAVDRQSSEPGEEPAPYTVTGRDAVILLALRIGGEQIGKLKEDEKKSPRNDPRVEKMTYAYFGFVGSTWARVPVPNGAD